LVYVKELGLGACSREEVEGSFKVGEAGEAFRKLMEYLDRLAEG